ncbi:hypothetical protein BH11ACT5_BH11ACT5_11850 [soil metagenome]
MIWFDLVSLILQFFVVAGLVFGAIQLIDAKRTVHRQLELTYVQRYWQLLDRLPVDIRATTYDGRTLLPQETAECVAYLELCEDEADLYERGRVTTDT